MFAYLFVRSLFPSRHFVTSLMIQFKIRHDVTSNGAHHIQLAKNSKETKRVNGDENQCEIVNREKPHLKVELNKKKWLTTVEHFK